MTRQAILEKISNLESELQKLKLEAYLQLPRKQRAFPRYPEQSILKAIKTTRNKIII